MQQEYSENQWQNEGATAFRCEHSQLGSCSLPCPQCKEVGFYSPRQAFADDKKVRKYRACKFCGFWQEAWGDVYNERGGAPYRCKMMHCSDCKRYDWKVPWAKELGPCGKCRSENTEEVAWPSDDPNHPFHTLKEQIRQAHENG